MSKKGKFILFWTAVFGITMGYFEASVVIYLRKIVYIEGFSFPLVEPEIDLIITELGREFMSVCMLVAVGVLAGRSHFERFVLFCFAFGFWDILYYVFLKLLIGWPESIFTWDILFLIPVPWVGPVWSPVLCAIGFIMAGILVVKQEETPHPVRPKISEWIIAIAGGTIVIISWCEEYRSIMAGESPESFAWPVYWIGFIMGAAAFGKAYLRSVRRVKDTGFRK